VKASVTTYQKQEVLAEKCPPPQVNTGKPVTFYECHPEDHAPAPSVRADLEYFRVYMASNFLVRKISIKKYPGLYPEKNDFLTHPSAIGKARNYLKQPVVAKSTE